MISRELIKATLITYDGIDEYGQEGINPINQTPIEITFGIYKHQPTEDIRFQNVEYVGLTKASVNDSQAIKIGDKEYKIQFVNPFGRYKEVFMITK